jgi:PIN domain nuclease of toxin-antitoxin system
MTLPILLDTCTAIWTVEGQISESSAALLTRNHQAGAMTFISPITSWEIGLLFSRGRLRSALSPREYVSRLTNFPNVSWALMSPEILVASSFLPGDPPRDPADRIIAATARELGCMILTRDHRLLDYAAQGHLGAVEC